MKNKSTLFLVQAALIAAVYVVLTLVFAPFSYGEIQVRISEALTILPFFTPAAIPGLFVGCILANLLGGAGIEFLAEARNVHAVLAERRANRGGGSRLGRVNLELDDSGYFLCHVEWHLLNNCGNGGTVFHVPPTGETG